jgi:protein TonB
MNDSSGQRAFSATWPWTPFGGTALGAPRFLAFLLLCLLAHLCVLAFLLWRTGARPAKRRTSSRRKLSR